VNSFQEILNSVIRETPDILMRELIKNKLEEIGIEIDDEIVDRLAKSIRDGDESFEWSDADQRKIAITFGDADIAVLERMSDSLMDEMPEMISQMSERLALDAVRSMRRDWRDQRFYEDLLFRQFQDNLHDRWSVGLENLRLLLGVSREIGESFHKKLARSKAKNGLFKRDVLARLHIRGCQVVAEIITLIESGFADGAMARWRTLFEISVVATLIADNGDALAERYLAHEAVEGRRAMDEFIRYHSALGHRPPSKRDISAVIARYDGAIERFGKPFSSSYGWAVGYLGTDNPNPKFSHLVEAAGRVMMRPYYKMASYNVHAGSKGILFRLGTIDDPGVLIAGATNAGLEEPGQNTAFTLTLLTLTLIGSRRRFDDLVQMRILALLRDKASSGFVRAAKKLRRDELALRQSKMSRKEV
jgi:hypothetical protein